tara:strand:+ start:4481 stop:5938 length:1458 start_codon:yes stop_codon:yes gene_type:complete
MSLNLQAKIPINAKFGLHYGSIGELPTLEQLMAIKSSARSLDCQLLAIDISTLLSAAQSQPEAVLELSIPTLGFTDPVFDFEATPRFATPLVMNGFVANSEDMTKRVANIYVTDIMNNQYALKFDKQGRVDYSAIAVEQSAAIYTTLKSIQYRYMFNQFVGGEGLQPLTHNEYQHKVLLLLPKTHPAFQIECALIVKQKSAMVKKYAVAASEIKSKTMQVEALWQGDIDKGSLQIDYHCQNNSVGSNIFEAELSVFLPQAENLQYLIYGSQAWLNTHQPKQPCLTQYYGLSSGVLLLILKTLVPYSLFCQNFSGSALCQNLGLDNINSYESGSDSLDTLYQYLLSAVLNRSMPLYALKPYMSHEADIFTEASALDMTKWSVHDQMVYQQILSSIEQVSASVEVMWDTLDSYLSFGPGDFAGKLLLETQGATLPKKPEASVTLSIKNDKPAYPLEPEYRHSEKSYQQVDSHLKKKGRGDSAHEDIE